MNPKQLRKKLAYLEFVNDQLTTELRYLDGILRMVGFPDGLKTIKLAAEELIDQTKNRAQKKEGGEH
jgi:hypothetical protein